MCPNGHKFGKGDVNLTYPNGRITVREAARLMHVNEQFIRIGLQRGVLPFGVAIQKGRKGRYTYHISPAKFYRKLSRKPTTLVVGMKAY